MKRLVILAFIAIPAFARVLSYAPYTNQPSRVGAHERSTRHFLVLEGPHEYFDRRNEVVLYDSAGIEEPRVVYPLSGTTSVDHAALYEPKGSALPWLLVDSNAKTFLSVDGGATWKQIPLENYMLNDPGEADFGGPFVQGLSAQILPGTNAYPFVLSQYGGCLRDQRDRNGEAAVHQQRLAASGRTQRGGRPFSDRRFR